MSLCGKRILSILMVLALAFGSLMVFGTISINSSVPVAVALTGPLTKADDNFVDINDDLTTYYPGDQDKEFDIDITHHYGRTAGDEDGIWDDNTGDNIDWSHAPPGGNGWVLAYTKVTIKGVVDADQKTATPFDNPKLTVWNNEGGQGFNLTSWSTQPYGLPDDGLDPFTFNIKKSVVPGTYFLQVDVKFKLRTSWWMEENRFNLTTEYTESESIEFEIRSGLDLDGDQDAVVKSDSGATIPLYAGASFQIIRIPVTGRSDDKTTIVATISVPTGITVSKGEDEATIPELNNGVTKFFEFRIEVSSTLAPQVLTGTTIEVKYFRDDIGTETADKVTESDIQIVLEIAFTPLLAPPLHNDFTEPAITITQGELETEFEQIEFLNTGNIELWDMEVTLYLGRAGYLTNGDFYYDEGSWGMDEELRTITFEFESLSKGAAKTIDFDTCLVNKYLPPGLYKVPITYQGWYMDKGELGDTSRWIKTKQDPYDLAAPQTDYRNINGVITGAPEDPYVFFEVVDNNGFSGEAICDQQFTQGDQGVNLGVDINNFEFYRLTDVTYTLSDNSTPGLSLVDISHQSIVLPAATGGGPGTDLTPNFVVNVQADALGVKTGTISLVGYHALSGEPITKDLDFAYEILPVPPVLTVVDVSVAGKVIPGKSTDITVTVMNTGGSDAQNITVLLSFNHALITVSGAYEVEIDELAPGDSDTVQFKVDAHKDIDQGEEYGGNVFVTYTDSQGNLIQYNANPATAVTVRCQEDQEEPFFTLASSVFWAGLFLLIGLVILGLLLFLSIKAIAAPKAEKKEEKPLPPPKERDDTPPPPPPKAEPMDDDKEDDSAHDTEKDPDLEPPEGLQEF